MNLKFSSSWLSLLAILCYTSSCSTTKKIHKSNSQKNLSQLITQSTVFQNAFTGFVLFDPLTEKTLYSQNQNHYFTPASNTKILSLYTAMKVLPGEASALKYAETDEGELYIQGTGHPDFLNPTFNQDKKNNTLTFLNSNKKPITFCTCNFQDKRYGSGWSWDDYYYAFQKEKSPLPIYGNSVRFSKASKKDTVAFYPAYFDKHLIFEFDSTITRPTIFRNWDNNQFYLKINPTATFSERNRPFRTDAATIVAMLSDTLHQKIKPCNNQCTKKHYKNIPSNTPTDTLYQELMQSSNNFVAEQLLLLCSDQLFDTLSTKKTINWALDSLFSSLEHQPKWVDGSGLSRYNLMTPKSIVQVLHQLYSEYPEERLFSLFPAGGYSGTIKDWYGGLDQTYVYAKTGTLRHIHCLSGYIVTKNKKTLIFSFMHNNHTGSQQILKREMELVLQLIYNQF